MRRSAAVVLAGAALAAVAGCGGQPSAGVHRSATTPTQPSATTATTSPSGPSSGPSSGPPTPVLTPTAAAGTPLGAGERVWAAFAQRGLPYRTWWAHLKPRLSDAAQAVYVYDDPRNLPALTLTGPLRLAPKPPAQPHFTAEVIVPTDRGVFRLDLERRATGAPWLLYAMTFPRSVQ